MQIVAALILSAFWAVSVDLSGTWTLDMYWPNDAHSSGGCTFEQTGTKLSGTCGSPKFPVTGEVNGNKATWQVDVEQGGHKGKMMFSGVIDDPATAIKGTCAVVGGPEGTFTMKRQQ